MEKVTGIKSVDFKVVALGHGVVNWNGPTNLASDGPMTANNHSMPKLRGFTNLSTRKKEGSDYVYRKSPVEVNFKETPLYISQNCIRHHLFKAQTYDVHFANKNEVSDLTRLLSSITGLVRGYVVTNTKCKRTSPLLIEDFVDQLGNGNFEQYSTDKHTDKNGNRDNTSFFSKTTFGDTKYISYGSISIEQLQFISLDPKFDRAAMIIKEGQGEVIAQQMQDFIQSLNSELAPTATFHHNYVRSGTIFEEGENGILLNDDAIQALVEYTLTLISELSIRQAKSYMYVDNITVDYNDSNKMMRIKRDESSVSETPDSKFANYFYEK